MAREEDFDDRVISLGERQRLAALGFAVEVEVERIRSGDRFSTSDEVVAAAEMYRKFLAEEATPKLAEEDRPFRVRNFNADGLLAADYYFAPQLVDLELQIEAAVTAQPVGGTSIVTCPRPLDAVTARVADRATFEPFPE